METYRARNAKTEEEEEDVYDEYYNDDYENSEEDDDYDDHQGSVTYNGEGYSDDDDDDEEQQQIMEGDDDIMKNGREMNANYFQGGHMYDEEESYDRALLEEEDDNIMYESYLDYDDKEDDEDSVDELEQEEENAISTALLSKASVDNFSNKNIPQAGIKQPLEPLGRICCSCGKYKLREEYQTKEWNKQLEDKTSKCQTCINFVLERRRMSAQVRKQVRHQTQNHVVSINKKRPCSPSRPSSKDEITDNVQKQKGEDDPCETDLFRIRKEPYIRPRTYYDPPWSDPSSNLHSGRKNRNKKESIGNIPPMMVNFEPYPLKTDNAPNDILGRYKIVYHSYYNASGGLFQYSQRQTSGFLELDTLWGDDAPVRGRVRWHPMLKMESFKKHFQTELYPTCDDFEFCETMNTNDEDDTNDDRFLSFHITRKPTDINLSTNTTCKCRLFMISDKCAAGWSPVDDPMDYSSISNAATKNKRITFRTLEDAERLKAETAINSRPPPMFLLEPGDLWLDVTWKENEIPIGGTTTFSLTQPQRATRSCSKHRRKEIVMSSIIVARDRKPLLLAEEEI